MICWKRSRAKNMKTRVSEYREAAVGYMNRRRLFYLRCLVCGIHQFFHTGHLQNWRSCARIMMPKGRMFLITANNKGKGV